MHICFIKNNTDLIKQQFYDISVILVLPLKLNVVKLVIKNRDYTFSMKENSN